MVPDLGPVAHVAVVVTDMEAAADWWCRVLGFERVGRFDEPPDGRRHPRILVRRPSAGVVVGLHEPHERSGDRFDPDRTGLDHLALSVGRRDDLDAWMTHLDGLGVPHSPVRRARQASFVSFEDPDGIQLELWWPGEGG